MSGNVVSIDGGILEGGGQILRIAASFSCILRQPITVTNIRGGRDKPGLRPQHLSGLELVAWMSRGKLTGNKPSSLTISLTPERLAGGDRIVDTKTAGSICLLVQVALPCVLFSSAPSRLKLMGGTNVSFAPQIEFMQWVLKPILERFGVHFELNTIKRGVYPSGGGIVEFSGNPVKCLKAIEMLDRGELTKIFGICLCTGKPSIAVARKMAQLATQHLEERYPDVPVKLDAVHDPSARDNYTGLILVAETSTGCLLSGSTLTSRYEPAEKTVEKAVHELCEHIDSGACADHYLQDQLLIFMVLAKGQSRILVGKPTLHTETAIHIAGLLTKAKFQTTPTKEGLYIVECEGIGFENDSL